MLELFLSVYGTLYLGLQILLLLGNVNRHLKVLIQWHSIIMLVHLFLVDTEIRVNLIELSLKILYGKFGSINLITRFTLSSLKFPHFIL